MRRASLIAIAFTCGALTAILTQPGVAYALVKINAFGVSVLNVCLLTY